MKILTNLDLSQNEIQNAIMQPLAAPPSNPKLGQIYFNSIDLTTSPRVQSHPRPRRR